MEFNEKKFEVKKDEKNGVLKVKVTLPKFTGKNPVGCRDGMGREYLINNQIEFGICIQSHCIANDSGQESAEWLFELPKKTLDKGPPPVVSSTSAKRSRNRSKAKVE
jgi:hypothetical protein